MNDTTLLNAKNAKDFGVIYAKTAPLLVYVAGQLGVARDERDDIAQQAYLRLIEADGTFTLDHAKAYLTRSVRTIVIDRSRRAKTRKTEAVGDWSTVTERPMWESDGANDAAVAAVEGALAALGDAGGADVLVWFYKDGLSVEEIRARLGSATGTVTAKLCRLRQKHAPALRAAVEDAVARAQR